MYKGSRFIREWLIALALAGSAFTFPLDAQVAYYPLDGNAIDISGNGLNGTLVGATPSTNRFGILQTALTFNGVSDLINCGASNVFCFQTNFTLSAWIKMNGLQAGKYIVAKYNGSSAPRSYGFGSEINTGRVYGFVSSSTGSFVECAGGSTLNDSKWHSLNFVYDNSFGMRLYVDDALVASKAAAGYAPFNNSPIPLTIGGLTSGQFFGGQIDDVRIYDRALSASEIDLLYRTDIGAEITVTPAIKLQVPTVPGKIYQFQSSFDLATWTALENPFTATTNPTVLYVDAVQTGQYFRLVAQ
jgi:hypothetical protein